MKFAGKYSLQKLSEQSTDIAKILNAGIKNSTCVLTEN
jgi:hypothetical protein